MEEPRFKSRAVDGVGSGRGGLEGANWRQA